ncbi:MAG: MFS transporter [Spirochaetes bacterium]|nr:MFS transporter [Spirochaetota bacterium]
MLTLSRKIITFSALYLAFVTIGLISNMAGPMMPHLKNILELNSMQTGMLISSNFAGMIIAVIFGGVIADITGKKRFLTAASVIVFLAMIMAVLSSGYLMLLSALIINGIGFGMFEVGINSYAVDFCRENRLSAEKNLNIIHFFFGIGAIVSPLVVKFSLGTMDYTLIFKLIMISAFSTAVILFFSSETVYGSDRRNLSDTFKFLVSQKLLWIAGVLVFLYVGIEVTSYGWLPEFWNKTVNAEYISAPVTASVFWGALTFGRLISAFVTEKLGNRLYMLLSAGLLVLTAGLWNILYNEISLIFLVIVIGLLLSGLFPAIINLSQKNNEGNSAVITSFVLIFASIGGSVVPVIAGGMVDIKGIMAVPAVITVTSLMFLLAAFYYSRFSKEND